MVTLSIPVVFKNRLDALEKAVPSSDGMLALIALTGYQTS